MLIGHAGPVAREQVWSTWSGDPLVILGLVGFVLLYGIGMAAARDRPAISAMVRRRAAAASGAVLALVVALVSPLDAAAQSLFSFHMLQHLLLSAVAAPLLVLATPAHTIRRALSSDGRRALARLPRWSAGPGRKGTGLAAGTLVLVGTMSVWHAPMLYDAALRSNDVHAFEHVTILAASALFWWAVVRATRRRQTLSSVIALAVVSAHGAALGALLALAPHPWYSEHADAARTWNVDALADQQVAGAAMWVPTAVVYLGAMAAMLHRALVEEPGGERVAAPPTRTGLDTPA